MVFWQAEVTDDGRYLVLHINVGTDVNNLVFYVDLEADFDVIELLPRLEAT